MRAASLLGIGFDGHAVTAHVAAMVERGVRCVVLFSRNMASRAQLVELCAELHALAAETPDDPVLVCVDHEGGRVQRFREGFTAVPAARDIGASGDAELEAEAWGRVAGRELRAAGIDLDFAPVVDVDSNPANPVIGARSFSSDPGRAALLATAFLRGLESEGVAGCAKHFPGHGDTALDSHLALPRLLHNAARLTAVELVPFRAAIAAGVASIMTAHILFEAIDAEVPATLSRRVVTGLLRDRLGFDGLVFSDDLEMKAIADGIGVARGAVGAVAAGCDVALVCADAARQLEAEAALDAALDDGTLDAECLAEAARRRRLARRR